MNPSQTGSTTSSPVCAKATSSPCPPIPSTVSLSTRSICTPSRAFTSIKTRQKHKPLSLLISGLAQAYTLARDTDPMLDKLADRFWPGPLTVIVRAGTKLPLRSTANTGNVALRVPDAAIPRAVVERFGLPITATSANLQGATECTHAACVRDQIGDRIPLIIDGGPTARAQPTTIVDLSLGPGRWEILREGAIPTHEIVMVLQR